MTVPCRDLIIDEINILFVIPDQSQDIPEIVGIARKEGDLKGYLEILPEAECLLGGEIKGGSFVLHYFMAEEA